MTKISSIINYYLTIYKFQKFGKWYIIPSLWVKLLFLNKLVKKWLDEGYYSLYGSIKRLYVSVKFLSAKSINLHVCNCNNVFREFWMELTLSNWTLFIKYVKMRFYYLKLFISNCSPSNLKSVPFSINFAQRQKYIENTFSK